MKTETKSQKLTGKFRDPQLKVYSTKKGAQILFAKSMNPTQEHYTVMRIDSASN